jgi:hypothetical protein
MTVAQLIERLKTFDPNLPVELSWSHGAEPGEVTDVDLSYSGKLVFIEGEQP